MPRRKFTDGFADFSAQIANIEKENDVADFNQNEPTEDTSAQDSQNTVDTRETGEHNSSDMNMVEREHEENEVSDSDETGGISGNNADIASNVDTTETANTLTFEYADPLFKIEPPTRKNKKTHRKVLLLTEEDYENILAESKALDTSFNNMVHLICQQRYKTS